MTGLIWEVKQTAAGLHNEDDVYTWYNTDAATNGNNAGTVNDNANCEANANNTCNTQAYVARVNTAGLCGANNWRLPTRKELHSLVDYGAPSTPQPHDRYHLFPEYSLIFLLVVLTICG